MAAPQFPGTQRMRETMHPKNEMYEKVKMAPQPKAGPQSYRPENDYRYMGTSNPTVISKRYRGGYR